MSICLKCQVRKLLCGLPRCPIADRISVFKLALSKASRLEIFGSTPPTAVVGEHGWPKVRIYVGEPPDVFGDDAKKYDDPSALWGLPLEEIAKLRSYLTFGVKTAKTPWELGELPLAAVSTRPVDLEIKLSKPPAPRLVFDLREKPLGPTAPLEKARVVDNPSVPKPLEKLISDNLTASEAAVELYARGVDIYTIQRAFALGLIGVKHRRRLVPSRWSITAVDTAVGDWLASKVRYFPEINSAVYAYGEYLDNKYLVLIKPGPLRFVYLERWHWRGKLVEVLVKEDVRGERSTMDGGYEAARVAVLEKLYALRRRGSVAIVRSIGEGYYISVGNWQIRETLRRVSFKPLDEEFKKYVDKVGANPLYLLKDEAKPITDFL